MTDKHGVGVTVVSHDSENRMLVDGYCPAGSYVHNISYLSGSITSAQQVAKLTDISAHCEPGLSSTNALTHSSSMVHATWVKAMTYRGAGNSTPYMCACGLNGSGADPLYGRHCDINDYVWREDSGLLTNKADLRFNWDLVIQGKLETMNEATTLLENWSVMVQVESAASYVNVRQSSVHVKDRMYQSIKSCNMIVERLESICQCSYLTCLNWMRLYTIGLTNRFKNWVCVRQRSVPWLGQPDLDILRLLIMFFPLPLLSCGLSTIFFIDSEIYETIPFQFPGCFSLLFEKNSRNTSSSKWNAYEARLNSLLYAFVRFFRLDLAQRSIALLSFWPYWPIKTSHCFIQSQFVNKKQKGCARAGSEEKWVSPRRK